MVNIKVLKHSESGNSAFCRCSTNFQGFSSEIGIGYLYKAEDTTELPDIGTILEYPGEVGFEPIIDKDTGNIATTKGGDQINRIVLK